MFLKTSLRPFRGHRTIHPAPSSAALPAQRVLLLHHRFACHVPCATRLRLSIASSLASLAYCSQCTSVHVPSSLRSQLFPQAHTHGRPLFPCVCLP